MKYWMETLAVVVFFAAVPWAMEAYVAYMDWIHKLFR